MTTLRAALLAAALAAGALAVSPRARAQDVETGPEDVPADNRFEGHLLRILRAHRNRDELRS